MNFPSPLVLIEHILRMRERAVDTCAAFLAASPRRRSAFYSLAALFASLLSLAYAKPSALPLDYFDQFVIGFTPVFFAVFAVVSWQNLFEYYGGKRSLALEYGVSALAVFLLCRSQAIDGSALSFLLQLGAVILLFAFSLRVFAAGIRWPGLICLALLLLALHFGLAEFDIRSGQPRQAWYANPTMALYLFLQGAAIALQAGRSAAWSSFFHPAHLVAPVPLFSVPERSPADLRTRVRGLMDIFFGLICLALATQLGRSFDFRAVPDGAGPVFLWDPLRSFARYFYYYLGSAIAIGWPVGLFRWSGVALPDYFSLPLLAWSPLERWRRWNTYAYQWYFRFAYLPVARRIPSPLLAVAAVFLLTAVIHMGKANFLWLAHFTRGYGLGFNSYMLLFFGAHGAAVYLALKLPRLFGDGKTAAGWRGVILTWALMALLHSIYFS